jgi:crotonobetainyl-CoA:carnitine CoA-transferase CaiB-like acyl-CoA transferase
MHTIENQGPLRGIRVIDLTTILLGPLATQMLGDMGADVIKVEAPEGDATRALGPPPTQAMGAIFLNCNRNKRSLVLNLKHSAARRALLQLAQSCDVFVHNMRPQAIERLGLSYDALRDACPDIIYCGTYGFRQGGPYSHKPAYDDMIQAASGIAALQPNAAGEPRYMTSVIADKITGMAVAQAILSALFHRERSGEGQAIEVPMFETLAAFNLVEHLYGATYLPPRGATGYPRALSPNRRPYASRDGYIGVLPYSDKQWRSLFAVAGRPELAEDERFRTLAARLAHIDEVYATLAELIATRTTQQWLDDLDAVNVPAVAVAAPADLIDDAHLNAVGFWHELEHPDLGRLRMPDIAARFSKTPGAIRRLPPQLGEHSVDVLREAGLSETAIADLVEQNITLQYR